MNRILWGLACCASLLAGCSDGLGPKRFSGTYGLFQVMGAAAPPFSVYVGGTRTTITLRIEVVGDTLELNEDGSFVQRTVYRSTENETTNPAVSIDTSTAVGTFSVDDAGSLTFLANVTPANCAFFCGLQMKTPTVVLVHGDTLAFQDVEFASLTWNPRYARRP
jgi:hypothetical protein